MLSTQLGRLLSPASFWTPKFIPTSAWLEHAPFAFWLSDALRPRCFVELGSHYGYSYFAFCQAFQQLGLHTAAYAIDTWEGDAHAGFYGEEVFSTVRRHNQENYSGFSTLVRNTFEQASHHFEDGSIDLLHIDGRHFYEDVQEDYLCWLPKLSPQAVVLFHDTNVRERNFGVRKFFQGLAQQHPAFNFEHGHGLGVLAPGAEVPQALRPLFDASAEERAQICTIYASLGKAITTKRALIAKTEALRAMLGYGAELSHEHAAPLGEIADGDIQVQEVLESLLRGSAESRELREALRAHEEVARQREAEAAEAVRLRRSAEAEAEAARLRESAAAEEAKFHAAELQRSLSEHARELNSWQLDMADLRHANEILRQELAAIYSSSSWKMMAPVQRALTRSPLLRRTSRRAAKLLWWGVTGQLTARLRERKALSLSTPLALSATSAASTASVSMAEPVLSVIPESARAIDLDYSLNLPLRFASADARAPGGRTGAIIHMFYPELAVEFRSYLRNIPGPVDLYVSVTSEFARQQVLCAFANWGKGEVDVRVMQNRGRDIAPKLVGFRDVYDKHEVVLHLHSKQSRHASVLTFWRHHLLENLLGTPETVQSVFELFHRNPKLGMVAAAHFEPVQHWVNWGNNLKQGMELGRRMGIAIDPNGVLDFPSGSMFWARSAALRPLLDLQLSFEDFPPESNQIDATLAHAIERIYFFVCEKAGFDWIKTARPELFSLHPAIISADEPDDLEQYFHRYVFRLLAPGGTRPRTLSPIAIPAPSPRLLDQARSHVLGEGRSIREGSRVTLGIVTYNNDEHGLRLGVSAAIQSLRSAGLPLDEAVLILDNGADSSLAVPVGREVRRLPSLGNIGFGAGHNRLMDQAFASGADLYIAVNPDGILHPGAVGALLRMVQAHDNRALVEALQFPMEHPKPYDATTLDTPWLSGACLAIPREVHEVLGGFDESFFMYCEDVDLSWRARAHGFPLKTCPTALFLHAVTNRPTSKATRTMVFESGVILARKWGSSSFEEWLRPELKALGAPLPEAAPLSVPAEWRHYADFNHHFSFAQPRW